MRMNLVRYRAHKMARGHRKAISRMVDLRRARGLRQSEVAQRMGVDTEVVRALESYDADPDLSMLRRYCLAIGATAKIRVVDLKEN